MPACPKCGAEVDGDATKCFYCGAAVPASVEAPSGAGTAPAASLPSNKNTIVALVLCVLVGILGVHRFYVGKVGTGILWVLTLGLAGVGWIVDIVKIAKGQFTDRQGRALSWQTSESGLKAEQWAVWSIRCGVAGGVALVLGAAAHATLFHLIAVIGGLAAIATGVASLRKIKSSPGLLGGSRMAKWGLGIGIAVVGLYLLTGVFSD